MDTVVAGALAAFTVDLLIYPLDTLKTRLQAPDFHSRFPSGRGLYAGLYQGVGSVIVATLPAAGIFFTTYEHAKSHLAGPESPLANAPPALSHMLASSTAELVSCLVLTPAEIIKQRAQVVNRQVASSSSSSSSRTSASAASTAKKVVQDVSAEAGNRPKARLLSSFGRSYLALAGRNLPFTAIQFPMYESLRKTFGQWAGLTAGTHSEDGGVDDVRSSDDFKRKARQDKTSVGTEFVKAGLVSGGSAAIAGSISAVVTTPIDVAKTRIMLDTGAAGTKPLGVIDTMRQIAAKEGLKALMKGGALRGAWTALGAGVYLGSYETGRLWWRDRQQRLNQ
ncbi:mitochondrial carrier [Testicularia cyperi]|uniref:Mitochondrial carrier n=1 Tax=Testicularia cyperi TaxID=1882483 RepID=A0A317XKX1_9BASI|nr:mitochondrial carrier [Testicularia cyperi]